MKLSGVIILVLFATLLYAGQIPSADQLLKKADSYRNPAESYKMTIVAKTPDTETTFEVFLKGTDKTLIVVKAPPKDRGRNMLMLDRDFYAYVPNLKRSIRLSLAQKFSGQVANGDIARTRWYGDYSPQIESTQGQETVLMLNGKRDNLTYQKIRLWVETATARPIHAEYLNLNGKSVLKQASFEDYKDIAGGVRPTSIRLTDVDKSQSTLQIQSMQATPLEDAIFTERNMEARQ